MALQAPAASENSTDPKVAELDAKIQKFQDLLKDETLSKDKYIYCHQMIQKFQQMKAELLNTQVVPAAPQSSNASTVQDVLSKVNSDIQRF